MEGVRCHVGNGGEGSALVRGCGVCFSCHCVRMCKQAGSSTD